MYFIILVLIDNDEPMLIQFRELINPIVGAILITFFFVHIQVVAGVELYSTTRSLTGVKKYKILSNKIRRIWFITPQTQMMIRFTFTRKKTTLLHNKPNICVRHQRSCLWQLINFILFDIHAISVDKPNRGGTRVNSCSSALVSRWRALRRLSIANIIQKLANR